MIKPSNNDDSHLFKRTNSKILS